MNQKELEKLQETYSYSKGNYKYIPMASEILKYIGQAVVLVTFKKIWKTEKNEEGEEIKSYTWQDSMDRAMIISISDYDPLTMTYLCKYKIEGSDNEIEVRIQPEGFEFCDTESESTEQFVRFVPYSYHCKMVEDEFTAARISELFEKRNTLEFEALQVISESKNQGQVLRYSNNIGLAVKMDSGVIFWVRIYKLKLKHRQGKKFGLFFSGEDNKEYSLVILSDETSYKVPGGEVKIIDLSD